MPIIADTVTLADGLLREPLPMSLLLAAIAKTGRVCRSCPRDSHPFVFSSSQRSNARYSPPDRARAERTSRCACDLTLGSLDRHPGSVAVRLSSSWAISR